MESVKTIAPKNKDRKPFGMLQPAATDKENLVGADRILRSTKLEESKTKQDVTETVKKDVSKCTEMTKKSKAVQTAQEEKIKIKVEDLTSDNPSENYWQILAERKQIEALVEALAENKKLVQYIKKLEIKNHVKSLQGSSG